MTDNQEIQWQQLVIDRCNKALKGYHNDCYYKNVLLIVKYLVSEIDKR